MAPSKISNVANKQSGTNVTNTRKRVTTRSQNAVLNNVLLKASIGKDSRIKRKAEASPPKEKTVKRSALGNITNVCYLIVPFLVLHFLFSYS